MFTFHYLIKGRHLRVYWAGSDCLLQGLWLQFATAKSGLCIRVIPTNRLLFWLTGWEP